MHVFMCDFTFSNKCKYIFSHIFVHGQIQIPHSLWLIASLMFDLSYDYF